MSQPHARTSPANEFTRVLFLLLYKILMIKKKVLLFLEPTIRGSGSLAFSWSRHIPRSIVVVCWAT